ncbi:hypothetical protein DXG01_012596 [Tephrocybe rancida]|nr:hypothetical protein DXG01_012596 [Tephrocybe rancida]
MNIPPIFADLCTLVSNLMENPIIIDDSDYSAVSYEGEWGAHGASGLEFDGTTHGTRDDGAQATVKFRGTSIAVLGTIEYGKGYAGAPNSSYMLDNAVPTLFSAFPSSTDPAYGCQFYQSPTLDPTVEHTLVITLVATGGNFLWLDRFTVEKEDVAATSMAASPSPIITYTVTSTVVHVVTGSTGPLVQPQSSTEAATASSTSRHSKGTTIGIAVGVVTGIILLGLTGLLSFYLIRRRRLARHASEEPVAHSVYRRSGYVVRGDRSSKKPDPYEQAMRRALAEPPPPMYRDANQGL